MKQLFTKIGIPILGIFFVVVLLLSFTTGVQAVLMNLKLSGGNVTGGDVDFFEVSPDGKYTVFTGDIQTNYVTKVFSVLTTGGTRVQLNGQLSLDMDVSTVLISPDSQTVVYLVEEPDRSIGLFAVPIGGGNPIELASNQSENVFFEKISISPDSGFVLFVEYHLTPDSIHPYYSVVKLVPITGGDSTLSYECANVGKYEATPDGSGVVFNAYYFAASDAIIWSNVTGDTQITLDNNGYFTNFKISPDGDYVVYVNYDTYNLYAVPISGGSPVMLNEELLSTERPISYQVSPNSQYVVYSASEEVDGQFLLYAVPTDGSSDRWPLITGSLPPESDVERFQITPDSQRVVVVGDFIVNDRQDIFSVSMSGSDPAYLNPGMLNSGDVKYFSITSNSIGVVFLANAIDVEKDELFAVFINGTGLHQVNMALPDGGNVVDFKISPNSQGVIYQADQDHNDIYELFAASTLGLVDPVKVNGELIPGGDVEGTQFAITPDNKGVVYIADQETDGVNELFITYDFNNVFLPSIIK